MTDTNAVPEPKGKLAAKAREFREALKHGDIGPLLLAPKVIDLTTRWSEYEEEADGLSAHAWLRRELGKGKTLAWFKRRAEAVEKLGEAIRRTVHHEVAVRVANKVPADKQELVIQALMRARLKNGHCALSPKQADLVIAEIVGKSPNPKVCRRCIVLEARIAELEGKSQAAE